MKKNLKVTQSSGPLSNGHVKAILRGGTFNRLQVLVNPHLTHIEHCGLRYDITLQKDSSGRVICTLARTEPSYS